MKRCTMRMGMIAIWTATFALPGSWPPAVAATSATGSGGSVPASRAPAVALTELRDALRDLASHVSPAVVQIEVSGFGPAEEGDRADASPIVRQHAVGAGVIVDPEGYIMTNAHVVEGAQRIRVRRLLSDAPAADGFPVERFQVLDAKLIGTEQLMDLALLKVEAVGLPVLPFNLDHAPKPGELVFAIGSPSGLQGSVTMGVVSAALRQPTPDQPMVYLQTDAPINHGNSGGPLVDVTGAIVGLNTFILSNSGGSEGLGFAIPARIVDFAYRSLRDNGRVDHVRIGVDVQTISPEIADGLLLARNWGVIISDVVAGGPADAAGLKPGDVLLAVDGNEIHSLPGFVAALYQHRPGQVLLIDVLRGSEKRSFRVRAVVAQDGTARLTDLADPMKSHIDRLGILGLDLGETLRLMAPGAVGRSGVLVLAHAPAFASVDTGLRVGDVIHALNRKPIETVEQLKGAVDDLSRGDAVVLQIEREGRLQYLAFAME